MTLPLPIDESFGICVANVASKLLTQLQTANPAIHGLSFMFGHPQELLNLLQIKGQGSERYLKFPVVMLFADVQSASTSVKGSHGDIILNGAICMSTQPTWTTSQRIANNFDPVLRPIFNELINTMWQSGYYHIQTPKALLPFGIERFYWGVTGVSGNTANKATEFIDAIEIKGMRVTPTLKGVRTPANTQKVWRTVVLNIVDNPARPVSLSNPLDPDIFIQVGSGKMMYKQYAPGATVTPICFGDTDGYLAGKMIELPWFYSDEPNSLVDFDGALGTWSDDTGFSSGAYLTIKFLDNV